MPTPAPPQVAVSVTVSAAVAFAAGAAAGGATAAVAGSVLAGTAGSATLGMLGVVQHFALSASVSANLSDPYRGAACSLQWSNFHFSMLGSGDAPSCKYYTYNALSDAAAAPASPPQAIASGRRLAGASRRALYLGPAAGAGGTVSPLEGSAGRSWGRWLAGLAWLGSGDDEQAPDGDPDMAWEDATPPGGFHEDEQYDPAHLGYYPPHLLYDGRGAPLGDAARGRRALLATLPADDMRQVAAQAYERLLLVLLCWVALLAGHWVSLKLWASCVCSADRPLPSLLVFPHPELLLLFVTFLALSQSAGALLGLSQPLPIAIGAIVVAFLLAAIGFVAYIAFALTRCRAALLDVDSRQVAAAVRRRMLMALDPDTGRWGAAVAAGELVGVKDPLNPARRVEAAGGVNGANGGMVRVMSHTSRRGSKVMPDSRPGPGAAEGTAVEGNRLLGRVISRTASQGALTRQRDSTGLRTGGGGGNGDADDSLDGVVRRAVSFAAPAAPSAAAQRQMDVAAREMSVSGAQRRVSVVGGRPVFSDVEEEKAKLRLRIAARLRERRAEREVLLEPVRTLVYLRTGLGLYQLLHLVSEAADAAAKGRSSAAKPTAGAGTPARTAAEAAAAAAGIGRASGKMTGSLALRSPAGGAAAGAPPPAPPPHAPVPTLGHARQALESGLYPINAMPVLATQSLSASPGNFLAYSHAFPGAAASGAHSGMFGPMPSANPYYPAAPHQDMPYGEAAVAYQGYGPAGGGGPASSAGSALFAPRPLLPDGSYASDGPSASPSSALFPASPLGAAAFGAGPGHSFGAASAGSALFAPTPATAVAAAAAAAAWGPGSGAYRNSPPETPPTSAGGRQSPAARESGRPSLARDSGSGRASPSVNRTAHLIMRHDRNFGSGSYASDGTPIGGGGGGGQRSPTSPPSGGGSGGGVSRSPSSFAPSRFARVSHGSAAAGGSARRSADFLQKSMSRVGRASRAVAEGLEKDEQEAQEQQEAEEEGGVGALTPVERFDDRVLGPVGTSSSRGQRQGWRGELHTSGRRRQGRGHAVAEATEDESVQQQQQQQGATYVAPAHLGAMHGHPAGAEPPAPFNPPQPQEGGWTQPGGASRALSTHPSHASHAHEAIEVTDYDGDMDESVAWAVLEQALYHQAVQLEAEVDQRMGRVLREEEEEEETDPEVEGGPDAGPGGGERAHAPLVSFAPLPAARKRAEPAPAAPRDATQQQRLQADREEMHKLVAAEDTDSPHLALARAMFAAVTGVGAAAGPTSASAPSSAGARKPKPILVRPSVMSLARIEFERRQAAGASGAAPMKIVVGPEGSLESAGGAQAPAPQASQVHSHSHATFNADGTVLEGGAAVGVEAEPSHGAGSEVTEPPAAAGVRFAADAHLGGESGRRPDDGEAAALPPREQSGLFPAHREQSTLFGPSAAAKAGETSQRFPGLSLVLDRGASRVARGTDEPAAPEPPFDLVAAEAAAAARGLTVSEPLIAFRGVGTHRRLLDMSKVERHKLLVQLQLEVRGLVPLRFRV